MNWAGLGWAGAGLADWTGWQQKGQAADGTDCTRQVLHHSLGASLHRPAMPCRTRTSRPVQTTDKCSRVSRSPSSPSSPS